MPPPAAAPRGGQGRPQSFSARKGQRWNGQKQQPPRPVPVRKQRRADHDAELDALRARRAAYAAAAAGGSALGGPAEDVTQFAHLALSKATLRGLSAAAYVDLTEIQRAAIPPALAGRDILGAAKTGSGKTLAFLVPLLECLVDKKWTPMDGVGALVISPTRELALQIFEVLRKVGRYHHFSAGLLIGGKSVADEATRIGRMSILIATPGRLLQHMDETPDFQADSLQMLVLDEADRLLDLGFKKTLNAILDFLPKQRQTLLFSATQTKSVKDLARLSLSDPTYVAVHENAQRATPDKLIQKFMVVPAEKKLDTLFSFLRTHTKAKILVFVSSCKQVRFIYESFCHLQPGLPLMQLHGRQKQEARMYVSADFARKKYACLFATDIVARGIDFPAVDWVIQLDCPEDVATYIHRVGRTARLGTSGSALLLLTPTEEKGFVHHLEQKSIPCDLIQSNPAKIMPIAHLLAGVNSRFPEIKYLGQKALISYLRSIHVQKDKTVFESVAEYNVAALSASMGLPGVPKMKFVQRAEKNQSRKHIEELAKTKEESDNEEEGQDEVDASPVQQADDESGGENDASGDESASDPKANNGRPKTRVDRLFARTNQTVLSSHYQKLVGTEAEGSGEEDDDFIKITRRDHGLSGSDDDEPDKNNEKKKKNSKSGKADAQDNKELRMPLIPPNPDGSAPSKRQLLKAKKKALKALPPRTKLVYDETQDELVPAYALQQLDEYVEETGGDLGAAAQRFLADQAEEMTQADQVDKAVAREKRREKRREKKRKLREAMGDAVGAPVLGAPDNDISGDDDNDNDNDFSASGGSDAGDDVEGAPPQKRTRYAEEEAESGSDDEGVFDGDDVDDDVDVDANVVAGLEERALELLGRR